jgi:hypothetical protein
MSDQYMKMVLIISVSKNQWNKFFQIYPNNSFCIVSGDCSWETDTLRELHFQEFQLWKKKAMRFWNSGMSAACGSAGEQLWVGACHSSWSHDTLLKLLVLAGYGFKFS